MNVFVQPLSILWAAEVMSELKTRANIMAGNICEQAEAWQQNLACFFQAPQVKKRKKTYVDAQERRSACVFLQAFHNMLLTGAGIRLRDFAGLQSAATPAPSAASQGPRAAAQDPEPADDEMPVLGGGEPDNERPVLEGSKPDDEMPVLGGGEPDSESDGEMPVLGGSEPGSESEDEMPVSEEGESDDEAAARTAEEAPRVLPEPEHSFWNLGPLWATHTMGDVKDVLRAIGWDAKPLQQTGPLHWKVEAVSDPPSRRIQTLDKKVTLTVSEHPNLEDASGDGKREANVTMAASCPSAPEMIVVMDPNLEDTSGDGKREANVTMAASCPFAPEMIVVMDEGSINFSAMWYLLFEKKFRILALRDPCHRSLGVAPAKHVV
jgi:hypothetical protein